MNNTNKEYKQIQNSELESWFSDDPKINRDKEIRERIRYPLLAKQMGLNWLDTSGMEIWDIGSGPFGGVAGILNSRKTICIDPLADEYRKHYPCTNYLSEQAESLKEKLATPDLIIITNAMDHFEYPEIFLDDLATYMKPGAFFAHLHAIDNAYSHPHEAHAHNVNPLMFHEALRADFEMVWSEEYQKDGLTYGWRKQKAFSGLYRKVTGYA